MKKQSILVLLFLAFQFLTFGQLTGIKTIPGNYPTMALAIADLNAQGVGSGGVTFNIAAGHTETFATSYDGLITVSNSSPANPIVFQKSETGSNPKIYAGYGEGINDYILCIAGTDYLTIDGIDLFESVNNTDAALQAEYGVVFAKADADTSGTQHCTIKNCTISLERSNTRTTGIIFRNWKGTAVGTLLGSINNTRKANSFNSIQGNLITNCFTGMYLYGSPSLAPYELHDQQNDIGSMAGNTITNFGGSSGSCYGLYTQYENALIVANNNITGYVPGGFCIGMEFQATPAASLDLYGNTISIQFDGTGFFYGIRNYMGNTATSSNVVNIHDNIVTGCTSPNSTSSVSYMELGHGGPVTNIYNNLITNNEYGSVSKSSNGEVHYLYVGYLPTTLGVANIYNNTVSNNIRYQLPTASGGVTRYMRLGPQCVTLNCYGNVCDNNTSTTNGTVYGIECPLASPVNKYIYGNRFTNQHNANGQTYCLSVTDGNNLTIYDNKIMNVEGQGTGSVITGLNIGFVSGNGNIFVYNNMIGNLKTGASSSNTAVTGMVIYGGSTAAQVGLYNNTISLHASSTGTNFGSAGLFISKFLKSADLRNNIIVNTSTPTGTGKTVALLTDSLNFGNLAVTSNNNLYYAGTPSAQRLIFTDGVTDNQTMLSYRSRFFPREVNSVSENPPFISVVNPVDLHLNPALATQCESGGVQVLFPMAVTNDIDAEPRYPYSGYPLNPEFPAVACDIGADEFGGIPADFTGPFIDYSPFANIATTENRTLTATITDAHGVPAAGTGLPRLCWKKNSGGTWSYVTGTHTTGNNYDFTFGGGTVLGDTVYYFVVAQDGWSTPNVGTRPLTGSGGFTANPPAASVIPLTPDRYVIVQSICGNFNVGAGGHYPTLTAAINDINNKGITCPITLTLTDNSYNAETYPITLLPNGGSSAVNTLTILPGAGVKPVFAGVSPGNGILKVNGFDHLIIDGAPASGSGKNITFYNASETAGAYAIGFFNFEKADPATNVVLRNCVIRGKSSLTVTNYGIYFSPEGGGYENIHITGDSIYAANTGIQMTGNFNHFNRNNQITDNVIGISDQLKYITNKGIVLQYSDNTLISGNDIMGPALGNNLPLQRGISLMAGTTATKIHGNFIHDFYRNVDNGSGAAGIWYEAESNTVTEIYNNSIYAIKSSGAAPGPSPNNCYGIYIKTGGNIKIVHNSIYLYGNLLSPTNSYDASSACIGIYQNGSLSNNIEIRNNILKNSMQGLTGQCPMTGRAFGIMTMSPDPSNFSVIDYNDYYIDGCSGQIGTLSFVNYATMPDWQAATGQEAHSTYIDPVFTTPQLLIPTSTQFFKAGTYLSAVPTDITGALRTNPPDLGAYEFSYGMSAHTDSASNVSVVSATLHGTLITAGQNCNVFFDFGPTTDYGSSVAATPPTITGIAPIPVTAVLTNLSAGTYHFRVRMVSFGNITVYGNDLTFSTIPDSLGVSGTAGSGYNGCFNATGVITVAGYGTTYLVENGASVTFIAGEKILFLPGAKVLSGGYLHGYITSDGQYCNSPDMPMVSNPVEIEKEVVSGQPDYAGTTARIYPNPAGFSFTAELSDINGDGMKSIGIFTTGGVQARFIKLNDDRKTIVTIDDLMPGLYFVRITTDKGTETCKLVKM